MTTDQQQDINYKTCQRIINLPYIAIIERQNVFMYWSYIGLSRWKDIILTKNDMVKWSEQYKVLLKYQN